MFAGHVGAALALGSAARRVNIGALIFAALLADVVLWMLVLSGREAVVIPADFATTHQAQFEFPYSHGLLASVAWSALAGAAYLLRRRHDDARAWRAAIVVAAAVFSHFILDALVHVPELPLLGAASSKVGFGLWRHMPLALAFEAAIVVAGLGLFVAGADWPRGRKLGLAALALAMLALTIAGMTVAPPPPSADAMAASSLATILAVCALAGWLGRQRPAG